MEGSPVQLSCQARDFDSIMWSLNGEVIPTDDSRFTFGNASLMVKSLTSMEEGSYVCLAANQLGAVASSMAVVQIAGEEICVKDVHL